MNPYLSRIHEFITQNQQISAEEKDQLSRIISEADKQWAIVDFKLDRTEKVKKTTAILLEETIEELEQKRKAVEESNNALQKSLEDLKAAQAQLVQSEKMASLGELTAGIAHEIQNPLNFVNNFSEVSRELVDELKQAFAEGDQQTVVDIADDLAGNLEKINHHGKRADSIVKGMLQHSRTSSGQKELTDINALCEEYLRLAYHGIRAKENDFNAKFEIHPDEDLPLVNVIPQDIGKVILNLINNAFYAVNEKWKAESCDPGTMFKPEVGVSTRKLGNSLEIIVKDNGKGIPDAIKGKIFQPFFTTKPTGQGTGLGLSLSYDIVTKGHGGELRMESREGMGTTFSILLPLKQP
jgi:signal transduction histidine kinase